ncbi:NAD(P)H-dependent oxidoreductase [Streptomyces sp. NPDC050439]|uniref:NADPH-dependent FMN reductase n=1 Tax=unclassified Streptomyces TaxID=2593676 RepID=UPI003437E8A4
MPEKPIKLAIIIGSVRGGRFGTTVAEWFAGQAELHGDVDAEVIDLLDHPLPLEMPAFGQQAPAEVAAVWSGLQARLVKADAFVVVTPEYNHAVPASLKNTIDWFRAEWVAKPVGLVSYGGVGGGLRSVEHLRQIFSEVHSMTVRESLSFHNAWADFEKEGEPVSPEGSDAAAEKLLDRLVWWADVLREARVRNPYIV